MKVYAFVGKSGTGKSHRAQWIARERGIHLIIDDGLLICDNRVLAGVSAKSESTKSASVKRAIFNDESHANIVKEAIKNQDLDKILLLGTSEKMVKLIVEALELPDIQEYIYIEDVASKEEIEMARINRMEQGKHVIPVPTFELKKEFGGYLLDPLKVFRKRNKDQKYIASDTTVIRPTYSYLGKYKISDYAIYTIIDNLIKTEFKVFKLHRGNIDIREADLIINITVSAEYGIIIDQKAFELQKRIKKFVEWMTGLTVKEINILVKNIIK